LIDGGETGAKASTVLDLTTTPITVLRKGKVPLLEIEKIRQETQAFLRNPLDS
jgi:tRNA A37 threonylcarbamoyladenosine synthetase subunit TsaC/SUA5/YrdC